MEHAPCGVEWTDAGVCVKCLCGWMSDPVNIGPHWVEKLQGYLDKHLAEVGSNA